MKIFKENILTKKSCLLCALFIILFLIIVFSLNTGIAKVNFKNFGSDLYLDNIILKIRLPRVLLAVLAGLILGATGAVMQSILRNPLASPYTLGISASSAFGAGLIIVLGRSFLNPVLVNNYFSVLTILGSFSIALITILIINQIAKAEKSNNTTIILAGVALSYLFSAGLSFFKYIADQDELSTLTIWLLGGLFRAEWLDILVLTPTALIGIYLLALLAWDINTLNAGAEIALNLGVNVKKLRRRGTIIATLLTSIVVSFTGIIAFIGLIAPHLSRMIFGSDNRYLIFASALLGAIILLTADTLARTIISPAEIPVGIITSLLGAPFFLYMLLKKRGYSL